LKEEIGFYQYKGLITSGNKRVQQPVGFRAFSKVHLERVPNLILFLDFYLIIQFKRLFFSQKLEKGIYLIFLYIYRI